ncbi:MAG: hydrogenase formation protein HypD [Candidatus Methanomethyliaceae archaeon]|nr:hydrogenase formation protein HypD [Candidatus Methanomethyliaceae archaeon]MDW7971018.1 hydrogenase formation protein HypD [Nitrososphaerota archaeon]
MEGDFLRFFRNKEIVEKIVKKIEEKAKHLEIIKIMHVCGTHEWTIAHFGIRSLLPDNIKVVAGPGCPVCVTPANEIDAIANLSLEKDVIVTTFGDVFRVPGSKTSLIEAKAMGGDVRIVYSISESIEIAKKTNRKVVHFSIGFETTAPTTALEILRNPPENFSAFVTHKLIPPAMEFLLKQGCKIDGFICPGHVSTIIGARPYRSLAEAYRKPMVIAGFEPLDVIIGIFNIITQIEEGTYYVYNEYSRAVKEEGNIEALRLLNEAFEYSDSWWRGIGLIERSGLKLKSKYEKYDALKKFNMELAKEDYMPEGCKCGEVLKGEIMPEECPLFKKVCTPTHPIGPCMVSIEGACAIAYKHSIKVF